jgi:hypothetical protein
MRPQLALIAGVAACFLVGFALVRLLARDDDDLPPELALGLAFPLGAGVIGVLSYLEILFTAPAFFWLAAAAGPAAFAALVIFRQPPSARWTMPWWLVLLIAALTVLALGLALWIPYRGGDGIWVHAFKARHLLAFPSAANPIFHDPNIVHCNEYSPLWAASLLVFFARLGGGFYAPWPHLALVFFFPSLMLIVYGALRQWVAPRVANWLTAIFALTPGYGFPLGGAYSHYVDIPLSTFYVAASVLLVRHLRRGAPGALPLAVLFGMAMTYTKNEGLPVFVILAIGVAIAALADRNAPARPWRAGLIALAASFWMLPFHLIFRGQIRTTHYQIWFRDLSFDTLILNLPRLPIIAWEMLRELANPAHWGPWWWAVAIALVLVARGRRLPHAWLLLAPVVTVLGASAFVYWQDFMDFRDHIRWSLDRIVLQVVPLAALFFAATWAAIQGHSTDSVPKDKS